MVLDLWAFSGGTLLYGNGNRVIMGTPEHIRFLQDRIGTQRYVCWGWDRTHLDRFRGMQFGIRNVITNLTGTFHTPRQWLTVLQAWRTDRRFIDLMGVRYMVMNRELRGENIRTIYAKDPIFISENQQAFPSAFLTRKIQVFKDPNDIFKEIATGQKNLLDVALLEEEISPLTDSPAEPPGKVFDIQDTPGRYSMHTEATGARQLVLIETYHPQWKCTVDGDQVSIALTDYNFMSVRVPPGKHEVKWWFEPTRFKQGLVVTCASSLIVLMFLTGSWFIKARKGT